MNKFDILKEINSIPSKILEANGSTYRGKTFAVVDICKIWDFYKTKKGAEGRIKRDSYISYYDESIMDMHNCGSGKSAMEIKESEICNINDKGVWYRYIEHLFKKNWLKTNDTIWEVKKYCNNEDTINFVIDLTNRIKNDNYLSMPIYKEYDYKEEVKEEEPATEITPELKNNSNEVKCNFNSE